MNFEHTEKNGEDLAITILGSRGSVPVHGEEFSVYGGATSSVQVIAGNEEIYLDAGSGIPSANPDASRRISLLISHFHLDHLVGLPFFKALSEKNREIRIYSEQKEGIDIREAIERLFNPPFWPLSLLKYPSDVRFLPISEGTMGVSAGVFMGGSTGGSTGGLTEGKEVAPAPGYGFNSCSNLTNPTTQDALIASGSGKAFFIGNVLVSCIEGSHPGGSTIYRLDYHGKSLVYATDFEHLPKAEKRLINFSKNCSLIIYDAQYFDGEYDRFTGYGHSTPGNGIRIAREAGAERILFFHHAPWRTDKDISEMEKKVQEEFPNASFARKGEKIFL